VSAPNAEGEPKFSLYGIDSTTLPILTFPPETFFGRLLNGVIRFGPRTPHFSIVTQSPYSHVLRALALNGLGIAWLPERCVREDIRNGNLLIVGNDKWTSAIEVRLYASPERAKLLEFNLWENIREWQESSLVTT